MTALQMVLPGWIRGRGVAVYLFVLQGAFAIGAIFWGFVAQKASLEAALVGAALALVVGGIVTIPLRISTYMESRAVPVRLVDLPTAVTSIYDDDGPIVATATWTVAPENMSGFIAAMVPVRKALKRHGALRFTLAEDVEQPGALTETFTMATWSEYQRLPDRSTGSDELIHDALVEASGGELPRITAHKQIQLRKPPAEKP
jgi:MFS family permease